ncbi:MAG: nucleotidyltransferase family protein [Novosphingobium sp.]
MDRPALRRVLLDLTGTASAYQIPALTQADWAELDRIAAQHRLQPLLHSQHRENSRVPSEIQAGWQAAHRVATMQAMVQQAELAETCAVLERAGFAPVALKGAWLAAQAYPEAAQRQMRDLDLLIEVAAVVPAFDLLRAAGYTQARPSEMPLEDVVRIDKHLPPLIAPRGTVIELHHRLWERDGRLDHASPTSGEAAVRQRAGLFAGIRYPAPQDLLVHLIVHAVYSHRLDCGPLVLADIDFLVRAAPIDWPRFWAEAEAEGWRDGARLLLELVQRYRPGAMMELPGDPPPPVLIEAAADLLLQDLDSRASAGFAAATLKSGPARFAARIAGRQQVSGEVSVRRDMATEGGFLGWAGSRLIRSIGDLARRDVRRQARQLSALSTWLDR